MPSNILVIPAKTGTHRCDPSAKDSDPAPRFCGNDKKAG
jgi:hypothetical protein